MYGHCQGIAPGVADGQQVQPGDLIATSGSTGNSTTPHVHYEVRQGRGADSFVDPTPFLG